VFIGSMSEGKVHALELDERYRARKLHVLARDLELPTGVAYRDGSLYVGALDRILRYEGIDGRLADPPKPGAVRDDLPAERHHGAKVVSFGPDGLLYVAVGVPCNVCEPSARHGLIMRMKPDGGEAATYARGIRNSVGFDWHPGTRELWFTDNGRDLLGDDVPPDELNHAPRPGLHFGFPYCHGARISDPQFGGKRGCAEFNAPAQELAPHAASLGMRFYRGAQFPGEYRNRIFIAEHGSWNRSRKIGYRITMVSVEGGKATGYQTFAEGWLQGEKAWGRPVDVLTLPDGSLLISDDHAGAIYRVTYRAG
jgi:glucose/arabinose dehydrogenase